MNYESLKKVGKKFGAILISPLSVIMVMPKYISIIFQRRHRQHRNSSFNSNFLPLTEREEQHFGMVRGPLFTSLGVLYMAEGALFAILAIGELQTWLSGSQFFIDHPDHWQVMARSFLGTHVFASFAVIGMPACMMSERGSDCLYDIVFFPIKRFFNINARNFLGHTDLHRAIMRSDLFETSQLLARGADPLSLTLDNKSILELAEEPFKQQLRESLSADTYSELERALNAHQAQDPRQNEVLQIGIIGIAESQASVPPARPLLSAFPNSRVSDSKSNSSVVNAVVNEATPLLMAQESERRRP